MALETTLKNVISKLFDNLLISGDTVTKTIEYYPFDSESYDRETRQNTKVYGNAITEKIIKLDLTNELIRQREGGEIQKTDAKIAIEGESTISPKMDDKFIIDNKTYHVYNIVKKEIGNSVLLYFVYGRL